MTATLPLIAHCYLLPCFRVFAPYSLSSLDRQKVYFSPSSHTRARSASLFLYLSFREALALPFARRHPPLNFFGALPSLGELRFPAATGQPPFPPKAYRGGVTLGKEYAMRSSVLVTHWS